MRLIGLFWKNERGSMVADIAKASVAIGLLSVVAANIISSRTGLDRDGLSRVASAAAGLQTIDPMVTGSIRKQIAETRLDPCTVQR